MKKPLTAAQKSEVKRLSEYNKSLGFFYAKGIKFQITRTFESKVHEKTMVEIKNIETGEYNRNDDGYVIPTSWLDYIKIIKKFRIENEHLKHLMK